MKSTIPNPVVLLSARIWEEMPAHLICAIVCSNFSGKNNPWLNVALVGHNQVAIESPYVEIILAGLDNKGDVDVRGDHLKVHGLAGALAAQERFSWYHVMNDGRATRCVALHTHPVSHTRQVDGRLNRKTEFAGEFRVSLLVLISDEECPPINSRDARNTVSRLEEASRSLLEPIVKA